MQRTLIRYTVIVIVFLGIIFIRGQKNSSADEKRSSLIDVAMIMFPGDHVAFLDKQSGKLYVYDGNLRQCLGIYRMDEPGQPFYKISK